jgi:hypothetical protein
MKELGGIIKSKQNNGDLNLFRLQDVLVVIEEGEDWWEVVDELGAPDHCTSISCDRLGTFSVQPAPQLILL